jgi:type I restriction enzyme, R subunit
MTNENEAFARILIDSALKESGWDLLNDKQVRFELSGKAGRSDYILFDNGEPLCVLEAKKETIDPYNAKEQARAYAKELKAPFIILSNGKMHYFWNYQLSNKQDAFRIEKLPSIEDLKFLQKRNLNPPLPLHKKLSVNYLQDKAPDIQLRRYQLQAVETITKEYDHGKKAFLLEMATGTGKTVLAATIIRRFLETRNASRVLFIVDRISLAKQTLETFKSLLNEYSPVLYKEARKRPAELLGSSVVVATLQSLMTGRRFKEEFTPFYFDLVINDEAHRSIYGDSRECVCYFQGTKIGLTATPKNYLKNINIEDLEKSNPKALEIRQLRDTYNYFGCEIGSPTFKYDLVDAANDPEGPFLCIPKIWDLRSDITTKSLEENGWTIEINEDEETYKLKDLERKVFIPERNKLICKAFLDKAIKSPDGNIGKSIVFAVNQRHATQLTKILNSIIPNIAVTIISNVKDASNIAKQFRKGHRDERIAVTVDMLSTGYDCKDALNLALMRPIFSPIQYLQIKGRGTRLFTWIIDNKEYVKDHFNIFDFCAVSEYFEEKYDYTSPLSLPNLTKENKDNKSNTSFINIDPIIDSSQNSNNKTKTIPTWIGKDIIISEKEKVIGPDGEKVDVFTFRGSFEKDIKDFAQNDKDFQEAVYSEDDDEINEILNEKFFNKPEMYYSLNKLIFSYGIPATSSDFVYNALNKRKLLSKDDLITNLTNSIASKNNLNYEQNKWVSILAQTISSDQDTLEKFMNEDPSIFDKSQFRHLGGLNILVNNSKVLEAFEILRNSTTMQNLYSANKQIGS